MSAPMSARPTPMTGGVAHPPPPGLNLDSTAEHPERENSDHSVPTLHESDSALAKGAFGPHHPLYNDLAPSDSYDANGVYWADLPWGAQQKWINAQSDAEAKRELLHLGAMIKRDPLSPVSAYFSRYVMGGFGLFTEGYTLFSIGNLTALFSAVWPHCWGEKAPRECDPNWIAAVTYLQIIGIIVGQILVGIEGDWIGRRFGLVQDALVMTLGLVMLTASWGNNLNGWIICYAWSQFIYGIGVGGEYPMTSTTALESKTTGANSQRDDKLHRGRNVVLAFLMQGWGQFINQAVLIILLLIFHHRGGPPYSKVSAQWTFRVSFGIMALMTLWLAYFRFWKKVYVSNSLSKDKARNNTSGYDSANLKLVMSHFGGRMIGTTVGWFTNDFLFYGAKLFQSSFIKIISPGAANNVIVGWNWNLVNVGVELFGYYLAAMLIDHKNYGRKKMQIIGDIAVAVCYLVCAIWYDELQSKAHIHGFQTIYFLSSFFQQFGPNCTTFLLAAEVYPVSVRATAHGLSAASGKLGALIPAVVYNYTANRTKFWIVCWFGFAGWLVTWAFIPDTTGLDLREQDRYWACVRAGRASDYHGIAVHPRHLSNWERFVLKRHLAYDPELDRQARVRELRAMFEAKRAQNGKEGLQIEQDIDDDDEVSSSASSYFAGFGPTKNGNGPVSEKPTRF